jgi:hypothetical protein
MNRELREVPFRGAEDLIDVDEELRKIARWFPHNIEIDIEIADQPVSHSNDFFPGTAGLSSLAGDSLAAASPASPDPSGLQDEHAVMLGAEPSRPQSESRLAMTSHMAVE